MSSVKEEEEDLKVRLKTLASLVINFCFKADVDDDVDEDDAEETNTAKKVEK